jgi:tripartite-type tricarboxylate transporter receptor subunit TctC
MSGCRSWIGVLAAAFTVTVASPAAQADDYPSKPVTIITPAAAGNSPDIVARLIADRLTQLWKQQVIILNRPGAGGLIGAQAAAQAEKDGYTLYMTQSSTWTVLPVLQPGKIPAEPEKSFAPIGMVGEQPMGMAVNKDVPVKSVAELVDYIKKQPNGILFSATNRGGQSHLTGELLRDRGKLNMSFVHSEGAAKSLTDVIAGRIPLVFEGLAGLKGGIEGGSIRLLAVTSAERLPNLPNVPTAAETVPGVVSNGWLALMAPAGVPDPIIRKVAADLKTVIAIPEVQERMHVLGTYSRDLTPAQLLEFIHSEEAKWWPIVRGVDRGQAAK